MIKKTRRYNSTPSPLALDLFPVGFNIKYIVTIFSYENLTSLLNGDFFKDKNLKHLIK